MVQDEKQDTTSKTFNQPTQARKENEAAVQKRSIVPSGVYVSQTNASDFLQMDLVDLLSR